MHPMGALARIDSIYLPLEELSMEQDTCRAMLCKAEEPWHALNVDEVARRFCTDIDSGLSDTECRRRIDECGPNIIERRKRRSWISMFLSQFTDPLVVVLLAAAVITFALADWVDTGVILAVVVINAGIGFIQEERAESAIEALSRLLKIQASVVRESRTVGVSSEDLVPGDLVMLQAGDKVPADLRLINEKNLQVDESVLTGESAPVSKSAIRVDPNVQISDRVCMAYSGTLVTAGSARGIVTATGNRTEIGLISDLILQAPVIATPLTRKLARFGKWLSTVVLGVALITLFIGIAIGRNPTEMFSAAVAIAVAVIPEGLPAIVTIVLAVGVQRMADRHTIIRTLPSVETLGSVTVICSDKTGTLTANEMTVRVAFAGDDDYEFGGIGYDPRDAVVAPVDTDDTELKSTVFIECMRCGLLCSDANITLHGDEWVASGDPTEVALIVAAMKAGLDPESHKMRWVRVDVMPFESANMYMATLNENPEGGRMIYLKGSVERVLDMCSNALTESGESDIMRDRIRDRADDLAREGLRILAFACKRVSSEIQCVSNEDLSELSFLGLQAMSDPARPEAIEAIRECRSAGIEVKMITGDNVVTARAVARDLGIGGSDVKSITGAELTNLTDDEFDRAARNSSVFARVAPEQKYRLVESLQSGRAVIAMTGDGVNDAPALKKADIGVAMGKAGSDVAKDASDMVLTDDNFASIVAAVEEGRTVFSNLLKTLAYILPTNAGEGLVIITALLSGFTLIVTPLQILWINTVTAVTLALPLAFEPKEQGLMDLPPRPPNSPLLPMALIFRIALVSVTMVVGAFVIFLYEGSMGASIESARTAAVGTIVAFEIFYLFSARSERTPVWQTPFFNNPYVWGGIFLVVLLQVAFTYLPSMNYFFGSAPIGWPVWGQILIISFPITLIVGAEKWARQRISARRALRPAATVDGD